MLMRHFLAGPLSRPARGHPIGVAATAVPGLLEPPPGLSDLPPARLVGALLGAVPVPSVTDPAQQEIARVQILFFSLGSVLITRPL